MRPRPETSFRDRVTYANVMSTLGVFIALGGTSYAAVKLPADSVGNKQLRDAAVTSQIIRDGAVTSADLAPGAVAAGPRGPKGSTGERGPQGASGLAPAEGWQALQLLDGWANYGGPFAGAAFTRDQLGAVHLRGLVTRASGPPTLGSLIGVLPPGYRPKGDRVFSVHTGHEPYSGGRVDVRADGVVTWIAGSVGEQDYTSLDGISFATN